MILRNMLITTSQLKRHYEGPVPCFSFPSGFPHIVSFVISIDKFTLLMNVFWQTALCCGTSRTQTLLCSRVSGKAQLTIFVDTQ